MHALSGARHTRGSSSGHTRRYLDRVAGLAAVGNFSARGTARDDILRLCSGLIPHELRRCLLLDEPDQRAGLSFVRSIGRASRSLAASLRSRAALASELELADVASSSEQDDSGSDAEGSEVLSDSDDVLTSGYGSGGSTDGAAHHFELGTSPIAQKAPNLPHSRRVPAPAPDSGGGPRLCLRCPEQIILGTSGGAVKRTRSGERISSTARPSIPDMPASTDATHALTRTRRGGISSDSGFID